jgi:hypothetical protein
MPGVGAKLIAISAVVGLLLAAATGPAVAAKPSAKQRAHVRKQLRKQIQRHPAVIRKRAFVRRAALVNFKLPITVRLSGATLPTNPNTATVDLGASLGQRAVGLGGTLAGEITFRDSFDGGALGNVDLDLLPSATKSLSTTSIPLLWNTDVTAAGTSWDATYLGGAVGCSNFTGTAPLPFGPGLLPGIPYYANAVDAAAGTPVAGYAPVIPGVDDPTLLTASNAIGDSNNLGSNPNPFPYSPSSVPGSFTQPPSVRDTIFRTTPLQLSIAAPGTQVQQDNGSPNGPQGSQNIVIGKSGGQANLFGNIPGKAWAIDVTVSLATRINSILRSMDPDLVPLISGLPWPATYAQCHQAYTGAVQNYIADVRLTGSLRISPGITADGHLRIAKATLASQAGFPTRIALAACLFPYSMYSAENNSSDTVANAVMASGSGPLPTNDLVARPAPTGVNCGATPTRLVADAPTVGLNAASAANGYTVTNDGSRVSVAGDLNVTNVSADVLIGDV